MSRIDLNVLLLSIAILPYTTAQAQLSFGGQPLGPGMSADHAEVTMPTVDVEALMAEDAQREAQGIKGPYRFGTNHEVDLSLANSGTWTELPNGDRLWRLAIICPGAFSINFEFHDLVVPEGGRVFVYNDMGDHLGGFTAESNPGQRTLGVDLLAGERITVEYFEPVSVAGEGILQIGQVTHGYRDILGLMKGLNDSGACNINSICPLGDPWRDQIRSVAMIVSGGGGICTGQLINNCEEDGRPFFLTARHCLPGNNNVGNWVFRFNWESPQCTPTQSSATNSLSGAQLRAQNASSDMALLELNNDPPENYDLFWSGWNRSNTPPQNSFAIHHPRGDIKKISFDEDPAANSNFNGAQTWRVINWEHGTTEPGSSGGALWDQNGLIVGQLFGGSASCNSNTSDYYGKFSTSWSSLAPHLGNCGNQLQGYPSTVNVSDIDGLSSGIVLAPNPGNGQVAVLLSEAWRNGGALLVRDGMGREVHVERISSGIDRMELDLSGQAAGLYFLELRTDGLRMTERLLIQH